MTNSNDKLSNFPQPYWIEAINLPEFPQLDKNINVDVTIVGGGITGIASAYLLAKEGVKVALLEAGCLMNGTTGHTTAKITAQHDLIYDELISNIGKVNAKLYYEANKEALSFIKKTVDQLDIACDFREEDAIIYATTEEYEKKLLDEASAYEQLGINGGLTEKKFLNIKMKNAIIMKKQAQFHPLKYLNALIQAVSGKDVQIFENTTAVKIETGQQPIVVTRGGASVKSNYVLMCSHFPFYEGTGLYSTRMYADRSYVLAAKTKQQFPGGMYLSAEKPAHSLRSVTIDNEEMVLFAGSAHKTGKSKDTLENYQALELFADETLGIEAISYHWSAQDLITLDKLPYIGAITSGKPNILVATGYRKWGMTNSHVAAQIFRDQILGRENKFAEIYTPSRFHPKPSMKSLAKVSTDILSQLAKGKLEKPETDSHSLANDEGAVITVDGQRKGAYRDVDGKLHIVDTTCTHVGCEVNWNNADRTWDCPCHGSRFTYTGEVLEGPAEKPLKKYDYKMIDNLISEDSGY